MDKSKNGLLFCIASCVLLGSYGKTQPINAAADPEQVEGAALAGDESAASGAGAQDSLVTRLEARLEFDRLTDEEQYQESLAVGERLVELTEEEFGGKSREAADAHTLLAAAQREAGEHDAAEQNYLAAIDIVRGIDGVFSPLAIGPLTGLGDNYQAAKRYLNAISAYGEARTVSRRMFGLLNEDQIPLLDRTTESLLALDRGVEADQQQIEALQLVERNHAPDSDEALAAIYKYASWLRDRGRYQEERLQYNRAIRLIRDRYGDASPMLVEPLLGIGNSFRYQRIPEGQGLSALKNALELLEAEQDPDALTVARGLRDLGDWQVAFSKVGYDGPEYNRAWQILGRVDNGAKVREDWFTGPEYVFREPISQRGLSREPDALSGFVLVKFDLDKSGHTENVEVVDSDPSGLKDESVLRHVRRSRFRPQMVDGEVVRGEALALQFTYRYVPDAKE